CGLKHRFLECVFGNVFEHLLRGANTKDGLPQRVEVACEEGADHETRVQLLKSGLLHQGFQLPTLRHDPGCKRIDVTILWEHVFRKLHEDGKIEFFDRAQRYDHDPTPRLGRTLQLACCVEWNGGEVHTIDCNRRIEGCILVWERLKISHFEMAFWD